MAEAKAGDEHSKFLGLEGAWKTAANLGIAAVMTFLFSFLVMHQIPSIQEKFHEELRAERQVFRDELRSLRESDARTGEKIAIAIEGAKEISANTQKMFAEQQRVMNENQRIMLKILEKVERAEPKKE
jgi:low affinity Fe/Cu permease